MVKSVLEGKLIDVKIMGKSLKRLIDSAREILGCDCEAGRRERV